MSTSEDYGYVVLTQDFQQVKFHSTVELKKGEIHKVYDEYNPDNPHIRISINGKLMVVPTNVTIKIINIQQLQQQMCLNANAGGKKKRTKRNKRVKSRRRIKGKSVRRRK
jgi:frataxin-like iron-binding protein CyaY